MARWFLSGSASQVRKETVRDRRAATRRLRFELLEDRWMLAIDWFVISTTTPGRVDLNVDDNDVDVVVSKMQHTDQQWYLTVNGDRLGAGSASIKVSDVRMIDIDADLGQDIDLSAVTAANGFGLTGVMVGMTMTDPVEITCGDGDNIVKGSGFVDEVHGGGGDDVLIGNKGADKLFGDDGVDYIFGHGAAWNAVTEKWEHSGTGDDDAWDRLEGGDEEDHLFGGGGNDTLKGDDGSDFLWGGDDDDDLFGGIGVDELFGEGGGDELYGEDGSDKLYGGDGYDHLVGGADALGTDEDFANGGTGVDVINLVDGFGNDTFVNVDGDLIDIDDDGPGGDEDDQEVEP